MKFLHYLFLTLPLFLLSSCVFYEEPGKTSPNLEWTYSMDVHDVYVLNDTLYSIENSQILVDNYKIESCTLGGYDEPFIVQDTCTIGFNPNPYEFEGEEEVFYVNCSMGENRIYIVPCVAFPNFPKFGHITRGGFFIIIGVESYDDIPKEAILTTYKFQYRNIIEDMWRFQ